MTDNAKLIVGIVDDEIDITDLFHDVLVQNIEGITVVTFNDPIIAFEHFTENKTSYAVMISDLRMSGLNGLELLKKIKSANNKVRTILMSAYNFDEVPTFQKYMKKGVIDSTIEKPVTINRLCQRVKEELDAYQPRIVKKR